MSICYIFSPKEFAGIEKEKSEHLPKISGHLTIQKSQACNYLPSGRISQTPMTRWAFRDYLPKDAALSLAEIHTLMMQSDFTLKLLKARSGPQGSISSRVWKSKPT